ncbi:hypothetical protein [Halobellus ordinarius]|uniref:hypothetical protein n=1 Tax=Halobellus ordinarius TaxID=3075120 RepID=UPI0028802E9D|nr:hypothetical protein [Halobellus sp. ZY16]
MRRRTVLARLAAAAPVALAGCTGGSGPGGTDTATATPDETETPDRTTVTPGLITASLLPRERCPDPGEATVSFGGDGPISLVGCVVGKNGCTVPRLAETDYDADTEEITVVVAAVEEREEDEACTEALVNLGYEVEIEVDDTPVTSVRVVHDDHHEDGRRTVVDVTK